MFIGEYQHNLDAKGRMSLPSSYRENLKDGGIITKGLDGCLAIYPKRAWLEWSGKIKKLSVSKQKARAFTRFQFASAMTFRVDGHGRILLPAFLRRYGKLKKNVVVAGVGDKIEVWDRATWEKVSQKSELENAKLVEDLAEEL